MTRTVVSCYEWVTTQRLVADTYRLASRLPSDLDAIVGMARSGLLPASLLACHLHLPLYAASEDRVTPVGGGWRARGQAGHRARVLLVDDTSCSGRTMREVKPWVQVAFPGAEVLTAVIYCTPRTWKAIDYAACEHESPHYLEWNYFNAGLFAKAAVDFDGILCEDIAPGDDDDGPRYRKALRHAVPKQLPRREPVPAIVTARLEKWREVTLEWLDRHRIRCQRLVMGPWSTLAERNRPGAVIAWKADQYAALPLAMFVESDLRQAQAIAVIAHKPVLCPAVGVVYT